MGFNVPMIIGTTLKRDHTFWPTLSPSEALTIQNIGTIPSQYKNLQRPTCTLAQMFAITSRVKEWSVSGGWSADDGVASGSSVFDNTPAIKIEMWTNFPSIFDPNKVEKENFIASQIPFTSGPFNYISDFGRQLVNLGHVSSINPGGTINRRYPVNQTPTASHLATLVLHADTTIANPNFGATPYGANVMVFDSDNFYPLFIFEDSVESTASRVFTCESASGADVSNATFEIETVIEDTILAPLIIKGNFGAVTATSTLKMTATKFFPYSNTLGEAIYDETSGAETGADPFA